jgi:hypothetical protein
LLIGAVSGHQSGFAVRKPYCIGVIILRDMGDFIVHAESR